MTLKTQAKVLRVLQEQKVEPVGGTATVTVDVRVIAATNKNLEEEIRKGHLPRGPLLPPERDPLPGAAAARAARGHPAPGPPLHRRALRRVRQAAEGADAARPWTLLVAQPWPGNVRELRNIIERLVIMTPGRPHRGAAPAGAARSARRRRRRAPSPRRGARRPPSPTSRPWPRPGRTSRSATSGRSTRSAAAT